MGSLRPTPWSSSSSTCAVGGGGGKNCDAELPNGGGADREENTLQERRNGDYVIKSFLKQARETCDGTFGGGNVGNNERESLISEWRLAKEGEDFFCGGGRLILLMNLCRY